ncbi:YihY/virulence factor BrkB family protein [Bdellovibrio sp. KM01]|uniref:YihY/virulence factor BrkB family protein n=1 Tax=Bdellovibrio sp. KM01 TaxID=2748865 RepID=UPI0015E9535B|nr:YihY/virulence factor BrkB family protein [Bdellovibrio sp. KM01]QLY24665.1 YihY/virulence factor BrkB family protein [Bdellovibrio sp. KM01]
MKLIKALKKITGKNFFNKMGRDDIFEMSASLSFYTALSLAPLLVLMLTFVALINDSFREEILRQIQYLFGTQSSDILREIVKNVEKQPEVRDTAGILGLITLIFSAGAIFGEMRMSLNKIFEVKIDYKKLESETFIQSIWTFMKTKLFNMGMVLTFVFISIVSLVVSSILSMYLKGAEALLGQFINFAISLLIFGLLFSAIYYFLPQVQVRPKVAFTSGFITAFMFSIGKGLIGLYMGQSAVASLYGAAGSFIVLLLWVYYSSAVIFLSAEVANEINKEEKYEETVQVPQ